MNLGISFFFVMIQNNELSFLLKVLLAISRRGTYNLKTERELYLQCSAEMPDLLCNSHGLDVERPFVLIRIFRFFSCFDANQPRLGI